MVPPRGNCSVPRPLGRGQDLSEDTVKLSLQWEVTAQTGCSGPSSPWLCIHLHVTLVVSALGCGLHISKSLKLNKMAYKALGAGLYPESMFGAPISL